MKATAITYDGPFIPQKIYRPPTSSDRVRYVEQVDLEHPIIFESADPDEYGISLGDALYSRIRRLKGPHQTVLAGVGPSISIRLEASIGRC